jgi:hypothetical protein
MWFVILIIALIAAGIYTGSAGFYVAAGIVGGIWLLFIVLAAVGVFVAKKHFDKEFKSFDNRYRGFH